MKSAAKVLLLAVIAAVFYPTPLTAQVRGKGMPNNTPNRGVSPTWPPNKPNPEFPVKPQQPNLTWIPQVINELTKIRPPQNIQQPPIYNPYRPPVYVQPTPVYVQPQSTPIYTQPAIVTSPTPVAPKNEIVTIKKKPIQPLAKNNTSYQLASTQAETDARQEVEASEMIGMLDIDASQQINTLAISDPTKAGLAVVWNEVVKKGSRKEDVDAFLEKYGPGPKGNNTLPAGIIDDLTFRQKVANYKDALRDGILTPDQKDAALLDIRNSQKIFALGKDPTAMQQLEKKITNMDNFNTMGKLAVAAQNTDNPFLILLQGANQMQMPPMFVSEMTGYPVMSVEPISDQTASDQTEGSSSATIIIDNPISNGQSVRYMLNTYSYTMDAGTQQILDRSYMITFDPASGSLQKRYSLTDGYYVWTSNPKSGWELQKTPVRVEIDNSRYNGVFNYMLNGERIQVAAGEIAEHSSGVPLEIAFNSGRNNQEHRKKLKPGRYFVGLNPEQGALDLFDFAKVDEAAEKEPPYQASTTIGGSNATQAQRVQALLGQFKSVNTRNDAPFGTQKAVSPLGRQKAATASVDDLLKSIKQPDR